jgi:hypothetical protein
LQFIIVEFILSIILVYLLSPHSWNTFNRSHFSHLTLVHNIPPYLPSYTFPYILPLPLVPTPRQDLFHQEEIYSEELTHWRPSSTDGLVSVW